MKSFINQSLYIILPLQQYSQITMFLSNQYVSEKIIEVVKFRRVEILLFPHLPSPILKRHGMYRDAHYHSHN
jgi:hypothetical protein